MTQPLIQQLAERAGIAPADCLVPGLLNAHETTRLLFELCAHLDEQAADKPEPPKPECHHHRLTKDCHECKPPAALVELRQVPRATGANAELVRIKAGVLDDITRQLERLVPGEVSLEDAINELAAARAERDTLTARVVELEAQVAGDDALIQKCNAENARLHQQWKDRADADGIWQSKMETELAKVTAERDALTVELAAVRRTLSAEASREQSAHEVTKRRLIEAQRDAVAISGHLSRARAVVEAARRYSDIAGEPIHYAPRLHALREALSALDKPAAAKEPCGNTVDRHEETFTCLLGKGHSGKCCYSFQVKPAAGELLHDRIPTHEGPSRVAVAARVPAAVVVEPREIRVGSMWRHVSGRLLKVRIVDISSVVTETSWWTHETFLQCHEWVSDPDPTAEEKEK